MREPKYKNWSPEERQRVEEWIQKLCPKYRLYDHDYTHKLVLSRGKGDIHAGARSVREALRQGKSAEGMLPEAWLWIWLAMYIDPEFSPDPWWESRIALWLEFRGKSTTVTQWGAQNCLGPEVEVLMYDGTRKRADQVCQGDLLMGPDSTPREVLELHSGESEMFRVTPKIGDSWTCTSDHNLALMCTRAHRSKGGKLPSKTHTYGRVWKISASEVFNWKSTRKVSYKQFREPWQLLERTYEVDPYIYGLWLGDGDRHRMAITNIDEPIIDAWKSYWEAQGCVITKTSFAARTPGYHATGGYVRGLHTKSPLNNFCKSSVVNGEKRIREDYLLGSIDQRRKLLAGIIDTDGTAGMTYFSIGSAYKSLAYDIKHLAESLGFLVSIRHKIGKYVKKDGSVASHYLLNISGDVNSIPIRLNRKLPKKVARNGAEKAGKGVRANGCSTITLEPIGTGPFFGWSVDRDGMFLLGDGTVTCNSGKTHAMWSFTRLMMLIWVGDCVAYISGPYKNSSDDKVWREFKDGMTYIQEERQELLKRWNLKMAIKVSEVYVKEPGSRRAGLTKFVSIAEASSVQGAKSRNHEIQGRRGIALFVNDEFIESPSNDLRRIVSNFSSNKSYFGLLGCNPLPSMVAHPKILAFSEPYDISRVSLKKNLHYRWATRVGVLVRYCWDNAPDRLLGRPADKPEYEYLMNKDRAELRSRDESDLRAAQLDAWGWGAEGATTLTDAARQRRAGVFDSYLVEGPRKLRSICIDPAFGGDDPASYCILEVAKIRRMIPGVNQWETVERICGVEQSTMPPIDADYCIDEDGWRVIQMIIRERERMKHTDADLTRLRSFTIGENVKGAVQCAILAAKICMDKDVPFDHLTFDASQRGDATAAFFDVFGRSTIRWFYEGSRSLLHEEGDEWFRWPRRYRHDDNTPEKWSQWCSQPNTMIWAFAAAIINEGKFIDGGNVQRGLDELGTREITQSRSGKMDLWSKKAIKSGRDGVTRMESPTFGETLAMGIYFLARYLQGLNLGAPGLVFTENGTGDTTDFLSSRAPIRRPGRRGGSGSLFDVVDEAEPEIKTLSKPPMSLEAMSELLHARGM